MARRRPLAAAAALAAITLVPAWARAQDPADLPPPASDPPSVSSGVDLLQKRSYWARSAGARPFVAAVLELGVIYFRPSLALGVGKPHWSWLGVEGYSSVSPSGGAEYVGLRAALPRLEIRGGARYAFSTSQYFLEPRASYTRRETELMQGPRSRYVAGEVEVSGSIPLLGGSLFGVATGYAVLGTPEGYYLYEEALHTVMKPPYLYRARLGYMEEMDRYGELRLGAAAEVLGNPGRDSLIVRVGPVLAISLTHHLDAVATVMVVAATPDRLGLLGADLGQLGLRYRWATGDRWPEFP
ncbi:hypothetical protein [Sorangium sp. So ce1153]|uniref:hypothetical protein n=1 Tax=Sorangium sp. So ce1153 TaxID=3133333 RepID=UPI003F603E75